MNSNYSSQGLEEMKLLENHDSSEIEKSSDDSDEIETSPDDWNDSDISGLLASQQELRRETDSIFSGILASQEESRRETDSIFSLHQNEFSVPQSWRLSERIQSEYFEKLQATLNAIIQRLSNLEQFVQKLANKEPSGSLSQVVASTNPSSNQVVASTNPVSNLLDNNSVTVNGNEDNNIQNIWDF